MTSLFCCSFINYFSFLLFSRTFWKRSVWYLFYSPELKKILYIKIVHDIPHLSFNHSIISAVGHVINISPCHVIILFGYCFSIICRMFDPSLLYHLSFLYHFSFLYYLSNWCNCSITGLTLGLVWTAGALSWQVVWGDRVGHGVLPRLNTVCSYELSGYRGDCWHAPRHFDEVRWQ